MALSIIWFDFGNVKTVGIMLVLQSDGSVISVNTDTGMSQTMLPAGSVIEPSVQTVGMSQWGSQYIIFVAAEQQNGYYLWDNVAVYQAGSLAPPVTMTANGSGYSNSPTVTASGGSGTGATFTATVLAGQITEIQITNPGSGYLPADLGMVTLTITDPTGTGATATVDIMPFGVNGNTVETYTGHVWVANQDHIVFSAPGSVTDFSTSSGGGAFTSTDSFLRRFYSRLKQSNGFLYLIGDSSVNYISGVVTSGVPPTTTFTNQNADPEIGTPWPATVDVFSRNILFINPFGAHVSYGGAVTKISDNLDTVYSSAPFGMFFPSAAKTILYGKKCWCFLIPVVDFRTGQQVNKIFMWDGKKWWSTQQSINLIYIAGQEINSVLTAYGTDGNKIYPLFQKPGDFTKCVMSRLWAQPGSLNQVKAANRLWGLAQYYQADNPDLTVGIDNETGENTEVLPMRGLAVTVINNAGAVVPVINNAGQVVTITAVGVGIITFPVQNFSQNGILIGMRITTNAADMALISMMIGVQEAYYVG